VRPSKSTVRELDAARFFKYIHSMNKFKKRWLQPRVLESLGFMPVTSITGMRQSGKTTLAQEISKKRIFHTLDDIGIRDQALRDPESLVRRNPVTFDEIQRAPELLLAIKRAVDRNRKAGSFLLTGSANLALMQGVSESLAGRALYLELPPFCPREWMQVEEQLLPLDRLFEDTFEVGEWPTELGNWSDWLMRGGLPPVLELQTDRQRSLWFGGYVQTYLERDLRQVSDVSHLADFQRMMCLAAQRTGRLMNASELARDAAIPQPTCQRWLNLLEAGYLIERLSVYDSAGKAGLVKSKKLFWSDCGLGAHLAGLQSAEGVEKRPDCGFWLEQAVYQSVRSWVSLDPYERKIWYWRDRRDREVDFILQKRDKIVAMEIKRSGTVRTEDSIGLKAFAESVSSDALVRSVVLHGGTQSRFLGEKVLALPWGWLFPK